MSEDKIAQALHAGLLSASESDMTGNADANVVDGLFALSRVINRLIDTIERQSPLLDEDDMRRAVAEGTTRAFDHMHSEDIQTAIVEGTREALAIMDPVAAIKEGIDGAFGVYPSQVLDAIADGTREALKEQR